MREIIREWSGRYNGLDERYLSFKAINDDMEEKHNAISEVILKMRMEHEDAKRNVRIRIEDEAHRR